MENRMEEMKREQIMDVQMENQLKSIFSMLIYNRVKEEKDIL